jgi:hypothetical protein
VTARAAAWWRAACNGELLWPGTRRVKSREPGLAAGCGLVCYERACLRLLVRPDEAELSVSHLAAAPSCSCLPGPAGRVCLQTHERESTVWSCG